MGGQSTTTQNQTQNQNSNANMDFSTLAKQLSQGTTASNFGQNTTTTAGPSEAAMANLNSASAPISGDAITGYMSPYIQNVVDTTMAQLGISNAKQQQDLRGNAIAQNALGGDRAKIAEAELMRNQGINNASTVANLYNTGYGQALSAAQTDEARKLQAAGLMGTTGTSTATGETTGATSGNTTNQVAGTQNTASQSNMTGTSGSTTYQPFGAGQAIGAGLTLAGMFARGGKVGDHHYDDGGSVQPYVPAGFGQIGQIPIMQPMQITHPAVSNNTPNYKEMYQLGQKARTGLGNLMNKIDPAKGWGASTVDTDSVGYGNSKFAGLGSMFGFADGGTAKGDLSRLSMISLPRASTSSGKGSGAVHLRDGGIASLADGGYANGEEPWTLSNALGKFSSDAPWRGFTSDKPEEPKPEETKPDVAPSLSYENSLLAKQQAAERNLGYIPNVMASTPQNGDMAKSDIEVPQPNIGNWSTEAIPTPEPKAPTTFAPISGELETGKKNPLEGVYSVSPDTRGSLSYGNFGINSWGGKTSSAAQFQREYGDQFGLTAPVGTEESKRQWQTAAAVDPAALHAAENDWYQKHVLTGTAEKLSEVGVSPEVAADPRVQAYFADRQVQQGPNSTLNHADRIKAAFDASGGDPEVFLKAQTAADKAAVRGDFRTYLSERPQDFGGLLNRSDRRFAAATGLGSEPTTFPGISEPGASPKNIGRLMDKATDPEQPAQKGYADGADANNGGLLKRLFGIDFNPLKLNERERYALISAGASMLANGNVGQGILTGQQMYQNIGKTDRQAQLDAMKMQMEFAKMNQPVVIGEEVDPNTGIVRKRYGAYDPATKQWPETNQSQTATIAPYLDPNMTAEDAVKAAPPVIADMAKNFANYKLPAPNGAAFRNPQVMAALSLAGKINSGFSQQDYKTQQATRISYSPQGKAGQQITSANTTIQHMLGTSERVQDLNNTWSPSWNKVKNIWNSDVRGRPELKRFQAAVLDHTAELGKLLKVGVLSQHEHDDMIKQVEASGSPAQLNGVLADQAERLSGRIMSLEQQRQDILHDPSLPPLLHKRSISALDVLYKRAGRGKSNEIGEPIRENTPQQSEIVQSKPVAEELVATPKIEPPKVSVTQRPQGKTDTQLIQDAQLAISHGADSNVVHEQMKQWGVRF